jgi:hypothetical protein
MLPIPFKPERANHLANALTISSRRRRAKPTRCRDPRRHGRSQREYRANLDEDYQAELQGWQNSPSPQSTSFVPLTSQKTMFQWVCCSGLSGCALESSPLPVWTLQRRSPTGARGRGRAKTRFSSSRVAHGVGKPMYRSCSGATIQTRAGAVLRSMRAI